MTDLENQVDSDSAPVLAPAARARTERLSEQRRALLAQRLRKGAGAAVRAPEIPRLPDGVEPPISFGQERLWFMEQLEPGTDAYVMRGAVRLRGRLHLDALRSALEDVVGRHDTLRTRFPVDESGRVSAVVVERVEVPFRVVPVDPEAGADPLDQAQTLTTRDCGPFDLTVAPLLRAMVVQLDPDDHVVHVAMHHIVGDGWSWPVFFADWAALYAARLDQAPAPAPMPIQYGDYAAWQRERLAGPAAERDLAYWRQALHGVPPLDLPVDRPRPAQPGWRGDGHQVRFPDDLVEGLRSLGREHGATLFMTLLAGLHVLLHRLSGQRDFAVGSPVAGRVRPELERLVGPFVNMLPLRADLRTELTFAQLLTQTRDRVLEALSHQELPFERLVQDLNVERDTSRSPIFQVLFGMHNTGGSAGEWPDGLERLPFGSPVTTTKHDLSLYVDEHPDGVRGSFGYRSELFDADTVARFAEHYRRLLAAAVARPDTPLADLDLMTEAERSAVLGLGTGAPAPQPADGTLADVIAPHVLATPDAPAIVHDGVATSYRDLDAGANRMAAWLRGHGVTRGSLVGVCLEQSAELAMALLGVLRAGAAYVPLDPEQPPARLGTIMADARPALVLTTSDLADRFESVATVRLDEVRDEIAGHSPLAPEPVAAPDDLAYVIFTSGSTGRPKGVAVAHRQVRNYLDGVTAQIGVVPAARWALLQSLSFDFAVTVFYLGLASGGAVHLVPRRCTGDELADYLREQRIDYLKMTPSHLAALAVEVPSERLVPAKALLLGGEASRLDWAAGLAAGPAAVINHYGPTEATVGVTTYRVEASDTGTGTTPIGKPLPHARVYVLDERMRPVPVGVPGELYLGGDRLARGYLGQPGLTAERFRPDPYATEPGARMYGTGDLARWRPDGQLEFLGRRDGQVKLRGYRVELGEVEAALVDCPGVSAAVAMLRGDRLVGYLQREAADDGSAPTDPDPGTLRRLLAGTLPEYMIPNQFVWLDRLPLQDHGKVDRRALPEPVAATAASGLEHVPPDGPVETAIAQVWQEVLEVERVGALDDFFDLGGHSLLATQVVARLRRTLTTERPISVMDLFRCRTVRELALLATGESGQPADRLLHELSRPPSGTRKRSYVCVPYGGANAVVYQPLADALPDGHSLYAVAVPGHDIGLAEEIEPIEVTAQRLTEEILNTITGPLVVYGHCGPGGALAVEVARRLEEAGRELDALYLGGIFPFARPVGGVLGRLTRLRLGERLRGDRVYANWLQGMGADLGALDTEQQRFLIRAMRHDGEAAENYFTELLHQHATPLRTPIISIVGDRDPGTEYHQERYREWHFLSDTTALVVLQEAGHYFAKFRADEVADIITAVDRELEQPVPAYNPDLSWQVTAVSRGAEPTAAVTTEQPGMGRFLTVAAGQLISGIGSALTTFAVPLWTYLETGSLIRFALFAVLGQVPGILAAPVAGAIIDRSDRRRAMLAGDFAALTAIASFAALYWTDQLQPWHIYTFVGWLSVALTFQRLAYMSAVPQLVPKRYLGHANGMVQLGGGVAQFLVPLVAVGLIATIGLGGILLIDLGSYLFAITVLVLVKFPRAMARRRRESLLAEITGGLRYTVQHRSFRAMVLFFAAFNLFLAPLFLLLSPLVLAFAPLESVAQVSLAGGVGAVVGGLIMTAWGGPRHRRMRGMLLLTFAFAAGGLVTGLRPSVAVVAAGALGMSLSLSVINGIWLTIIQTKVPQRLHARVIALNMVIALSTMPLGQAVIAPLLVPRFEPLLLPGGSLADSVGQVIGVGPGRGTGLLYILLAVCVAVVVAVSLRVRTLARFDDDVPDAPPDDLVGLSNWTARVQSRTAAGSHQGSGSGG
ncbi:non-ribosomal peptide synthetase/MFS transporter [Micromonospora sp. NBC_01796]|uniref:non-ribosomal peptide synthetase/MFS transporter n=1 Tax=Micromonospora sp. NBC_01796 TaxID=2975987 RepID=UPI002DD8FFD0|nr:non-ribosomal peptide synthetase [Micromonospora sp. NBC_01796]WSA84808.1 amino acid adenylation domain-containing protein [Micromonospora sp. NBC_01796]